MLTGLVNTPLAFVMAPAHAQRLKTEVITLGFRSVNEILPVIQPLVPPPGVVTGLQNQLIVKTTPGNLAEIKTLLKSLDRAPANLLITVRHQLDEEIKRDLTRARARIKTGRVRASVGSKAGGSGLNAQAGGSRASAGINIQSSTRSASSRDKQRIRVLEGRQAFIQTGVSVPYSQGTTVVNGNRVTTVRTTQFRDVGTGLYVRPQLFGDQVRLEISQHRDRLQGGASGGQISVNESNSAVSTVLGEWTELAANVSESSSSRSGLTSSANRQSSSTHRVYVKVERLP